MARQTNADSNVAMNILKGAVAGAVGAWAMDQITSFFAEQEEPEVLSSETRVRPGGDTPQKLMAKKIAETAGYELAPRQTEYGGSMAHYAVGMLPAAVYAASRSRRGPNWGRGMMLGLGMFVLQDEIGNWAFGLADRPDKYPWQTHLRGLIGHLGYGAATEGTLSILDNGVDRIEEMASKTRRQIEEELKDRRAQRRSERPADEKHEKRPPHV